MNTHLWEAKHSYYWNEGAFCAAGYHQEDQSWSDFMADMGDADEDYNALLRWDWKLDYADEVTEETPVEPVGTGTLQLRFVLQRKGVCLSRNVRVTPADEPAVREYLQTKWAYVKALWAPLSEMAP